MGAQRRSLVQAPGEPAIGTFTLRTYFGDHWSDEVRGTLEKARIDLRRGALSAVVDSVERYVRDTSEAPDDASAWLLALVHALAGRARVELSDRKSGVPLLERSIRLARSATRLDTDPEDVADLAAAFRLLDRPDDAVQVIRSEPETVPGWRPWRVRLELARALHGSGRPAEAIPELDAALVDKPSEPFLLLERALCHEATGSAQEGARDAAAAAAIFDARDRKEFVELAVSTAERMLPDDPAVLTLRAQLSLDDQPQMALELAERALASGESSGWAETIRASALLQVGDDDGALAASLAFLARDPHDLTCLNTCAVVYAQRNELEQMQPLLDAAISSRAPNAALLLLAGSVHAARGDDAAALVSYDQALDRAPGDPAAMRAVGMTHFRLGNLAEAEQHFEQLVKATPTVESAWFALAETRRLLGDLDGAMTAIERAGRTPATIGTLGEILYGLGRREEAVAHLAEAFQLDEDSTPWIALSYATVLVATGETTLVPDVMATYVASRPSEDRLTAVRYAAGLLGESGLWRDAMPFVREIIEAAPHDPAARELLIQGLANTDGFAELASQADQGRGELSDLSVALVADALRLVGRSDEAIAWATEVIDAREQVSDETSDEVAALALRVRGDAHRILGDLAAAGPDLRAALDLEPDDQFSAVALGRTLRMSHPAEAAELLGRAVATGTADLAITAELADALLTSGDPQTALGYSSKAVEAYATSEPPDPVGAAWAWGVHGAVLRTLRQPLEALAALDRSVELNPQPQSWIRAERVYCFLAMDDGEAAVRQAEQVFQEQPDDPGAAAAYALALLDVDEPTAALEVVDSAPSQGPTGWRDGLRAQVLINLARYAEASMQLDGMEGGPGSDVWTVTRIVQALLRQHPVDTARAWDILQTTAEADRTDPIWVVSCAEVLAHLGRDDEARRQFQLVVDLVHGAGPPTADDLHLTGWAQLRLGEPRKAIRLFVRALDLHRRPTIQFDLALATLHTSHADRAEVEYARGFAMIDQLDDRARQAAILLDAADDLDGCVNLLGSLEPDALAVDSAREALRERLVVLGRNPVATGRSNRLPAVTSQKQ